jgi:hypothetical protein
MNNYLCTRCEKKYPNRKENVFATRKQVRLHLREEHGLGHEGSSGIVGKNKGRGRGDMKCGCLAKHYEVKEAA